MRFECLLDTARTLQGVQHFKPYQHSGHIVTKSDREECILGSLRSYLKMDFMPVSAVAVAMLVRVHGSSMRSSCVSARIYAPVLLLLMDSTACWPVLSPAALQGQGGCIGNIRAHGRAQPEDKYRRTIRDMPVGGFCDLLCIVRAAADALSARLIPLRS